MAAAQSAASAKSMHRTAASTAIEQFRRAAKAACIELKRRIRKDQFKFWQLRSNDKTAPEVCNAVVAT
jgi:hypothetical protein